MKRLFVMCKLMHLNMNFYKASSIALSLLCIIQDKLIPLQYKPV